MRIKGLDIDIYRLYHTNRSSKSGIKLERKLLEAVLESESDIEFWFLTLTQWKRRLALQE